MGSVPSLWGTGLQHTGAPSFAPLASLLTDSLSTREEPTHSVLQGSGPLCLVPQQFPTSSLESAVSHSPTCVMSAQAQPLLSTVPSPCHTLDPAACLDDYGDTVNGSSLQS